MEFSRLVAPMMRRVRLMLGRAVVNIVNDTLKAQNMQVSMLDDETPDEVERLQNYGLISVPLAGAEAVVGCIGADRDHAVALVVEDRRYRPTGLEDGDTGVYHYEGHRLRLTKEGKVILTCKTLQIDAEQSVTVNTPQTTFTGDVAIQKGLSVQQHSRFASNITAPDAIINGKSTDGHTHRGDSGGNTGPMQ